MAKLFPWDTWLEMETMREGMKHLVEEGVCASPFTRGSRTLAQFRPVADVLETEDSFVILIELPGMSREDVSLEIHGSELAVFGERVLPIDTSGIAFQAMERSYGCFSRRFTLPVEVNGAAVEARMKDGLLRVLIPKEPPRDSKRAILVTVDE